MTKSVSSDTQAPEKAQTSRGVRRARAAPAEDGARNKRVKENVVFESHRIVQQWKSLADSYEIRNSRTKRIGRVRAAKILGFAKKTLELHNRTFKALEELQISWNEYAHSGMGVLYALVASERTRASNGVAPAVAFEDTYDDSNSSSHEDVAATTSAAAAAVMTATSTDVTVPAAATTIEEEPSDAQLSAHCEQIHSDSQDVYTGTSSCAQSQPVNPIQGMQSGSTSADAYPAYVLPSFADFDPYAEFPDFLAQIEDPTLENGFN